MREARDLALAVFQRAPRETSLARRSSAARSALSKRVAVLERKISPGQLEDLVNYDAALVRRLDSGDDPWTRG